ncbi:hypothetical protein ED733_007341 [Metarhizium rileyi]|uniref:Ubiquitin carboxyl-terminal hydrolase n=1 Tax=Metarhizium rileyi (strain RCEF 4871) TaxID=1649241 RepID=A0A5C6GJK8_METRR|nr:hypothetical protein ED733_007341 [Metarhizium rileyi]
MERPRRNPKRKAQETADASDVSPRHLLEKSCRPLTSQEIEEWEGWIELESEPAFFNIILRDLGVKDVKTQELFTIDQASLDALSKPVFGLIFLFQYEPAHEEEDQPTTNNACATVALLNIIMNSDNLNLGERLQSFKESTEGLCTALRGHSISSNKYIRKVHNSLTRRMDQLNADLCLENDVETASKIEGKQKRKSKKGALEEYGYHFVAYVPSGGCAWELDGLKSNPLNLGPLASQDWTTIVRPQIEARMLQYEDSQLSFNLLAVCHDPLVQHSQVIASMLAALSYIRSQMKDCEAFNELVSGEEPVLDTNNQTQLAEFNLTYSDIENAEVPHRLRVAVSRSSLDVTNAYQFYQQFCKAARTAMGGFRAELIARVEDERRVEGRRRDYGSALHCWVQKLADKGVLEDIIKMSL